MAPEGSAMFISRFRNRPAYTVIIKALHWAPVRTARNRKAGTSRKGVSSRAPIQRGRFGSYFWQGGPRLVEWRKERPSTGASERCNGTWRPGLPGVLHPEEGPAMLRMRAGRGRIAWRVGNGAFVTGTCRFVNKARFRSGTGIVFQQNGHFYCPHCDKVVAFGFFC